MANTLYIEQIEIADKTDQLGTSCHMELVSKTPSNSMPAEFSLPGDTNTLSASTLRPTGETIQVSLAYGETAGHVAFQGLIEHIDDMEDADKFVYSIDMMNLPQGYPHRNQVSEIYNQVTILTGYTDTTAHFVLQDICNRAGVSLGRIDMPDYNLWGNYEVIRKTPVEVAKELCDPFNKFDFFKYIVRCDNNGLQIIGFDYTLGAMTPNAHVIPSFISKKRTFSIYNPDQRIGPSDVLITGGDIYGNNGAYTLTGYCHKKFSSSSKDITPLTDSTTGASPDNPTNAGALPNFTNWTETDTDIIFLIDMTINSPDDPRISRGGIDFNSELDLNLAQLESGACDSIKVRETYVMKEVVSVFDSFNGKTEDTVTRYTYDMFTFNAGVFHDGSQPNQCIQGIPGYYAPQIKATMTSVLNTAYTTCGPYPISYVKTWYGYATDGSLQYKNTGTYYNYRGEWVLQSMQEDPGSVEEATTALIQFYDNIRVIDQPDAIHGAKTEIGKYQLRNGVSVPPVQLQRLPCILSEEGERLKDFVINNAFQMSGPYMDYGGLQLLWTMAQREQQLERLNAYWENITLVCPIDTSAVLGESIILDGSGGIVEDVKHTITAMSALTTIQVKRIVYSSAGVVAPLPTLAGNYVSDPYASVLVQTPTGVTSIGFPTGSVNQICYPDTFNLWNYIGTSPLNWNG